MSYIVDGHPDALITAGIYDGVSGQVAKTHSPNEVVIAKLESKWLREAALRRGRPNMQLLGGGQASIATKTAFFSTMSPEYNRPSDNLGTVIMNELKVNYSGLSKVFQNTDYGSWNRNLVDPIIGGIAGGPEGATLACVASILLGIVVNHGDLHAINPIHRQLLSTSTRMCLWLMSMTGQAFALNAPQVLISGAHFLSAGPGEKMLLEEEAAVAIATVTSGLHVGSGPCPAQCKVPNHFSGLDGIFACEVGHAVARTQWSRDEANDVVKMLLDRYEKRQADPPLGQPFQETYDVKTITPKPAWQKVYDDMIAELEKLGLDFNL
jgi:methylamine--corrinoid protein Co-methyltransferase